MQNLKYWITLSKLSLLFLLDIQVLFVKALLHQQIGYLIFFKSKIYKYIVEWYSYVFNLKVSSCKL